MYQAFREQCEKLLRIPPQPTAPPGDDSTTRVFRAAPNFYKYLIAIWAIQSFTTVIFALAAMLIPTGVLLTQFRHGGGNLASLALVIPMFIGALMLAGIIVRLAILKLDFEKRWYLVTDRSLRIREGVLNVREMTVTFANIQNISISQGPIQRALGISDLVVETAGGGAVSAQHGQAGQNLHTAAFRGIDNAQEVRQLIEARLKKLKDSGLGDHDDHPIVSAPANSTVLEILAQIHAEAGKLREAAGRI